MPPAERDAAVRTFLVLALLALIAAAAAFGYARWQAEPAAGLAFETGKVGRGEVRQTVTTSGSVRPLVTVEVGSQLSGQIAEVYADDSSPVRQGQEIARIDPRSFATRVREAEAAVQVAEAEAALQRAGVARAEAGLRQAEREHGRAETLQARGNTSQAVLDSALAALETAQAGLAIARAEVANADAAVLQRQAALDSATIDLDRTFIRSPIEGVVIERAVEVGQTVAASLSAPKLFTIAQDLTRIQIDAQVDEADIGAVAVGNTVKFTVDAYPERTFQGVVSEIRLAPVTLQNVVTYTAVIDADNGDGRLLPGMTANVEILTALRRDVRVVPSEALRFRPRGAAAALARGAEPPGPGGPAVWTLAADGTLQRVAVSTGLADRNWTELTGPLPPEGTPVVLRQRGPGG